MTRFPKTHEHRQKPLRAMRAMKMAASAHAYVRGSTARFYEWLASQNQSAIPDGPPIWICGDAHVGNLGPLARCDAAIVVQIRDLDQTVVGNPAHDLVRLALSLAMCARSSDLPGVTTARLVEELMHGYLEALAPGHRTTSTIESDAVRLVLREAVRRKWRHLHHDRLEDDVKLPLGSRFWPLTRHERHDIETFLEAERLRKLVTLLACREDDADIRLVDAAYWVKGCSSLGLWRCAALVRVKGKSKTGGGYSLLDIKQAVSPLAPQSETFELPRNQGERVVAGARVIAPALGERMVSGVVGNRDVFVRELLPQDLKVELDVLDAPEARAVARTLARVVGEAHARQMDRATRKAWRGTLMRAVSRSLDAPGWLWTSVVDMVTAHERSYLEHCRRHVLSLPRVA